MSYFVYNVLGENAITHQHWFLSKWIDFMCYYTH